MSGIDTKGWPFGQREFATVLSMFEYGHWKSGWITNGRPDIQSFVWCRHIRGVNSTVSISYICIYVYIYTQPGTAMRYTASYGVSIMRIIEEIDSVITTLTHIYIYTNDKKHIYACVNITRQRKKQNVLHILSFLLSVSRKWPGNILVMHHGLQMQLSILVIMGWWRLLSLIIWVC